LVIRPIEEIMYYERKDGSFGLRFPMGIEAGKLGKMLRSAAQKVEKRERTASKKGARNHH
jgi:hypothetical protein